MMIIAEVVGEAERLRSASFERKPNDSELCSLAGLRSMTRVQDRMTTNLEHAEVVELVDAAQDARVSRRTGCPGATTLTGRKASSLR